jgi:hypothetical protein
MVGADLRDARLGTSTSARTQKARMSARTHPRELDGADLTEPISAARARSRAAGARLGGALAARSSRAVGPEAYLGDADLQRREPDRRSVFGEPEEAILAPTRSCGSRRMARRALALCARRI